jgi:hypothetical protein
MSLSSSWGRFFPRQRYSGDQVPLPFVNGLNSTYDDVGAKSVEISQPSDGLEKRQATIHLTFRPVLVEPFFGAGDKRKNRKPVVPRDAIQPRAVLVFRGLGKRISSVEKAAWHPDVDVIFQKKAWVDRPVAQKIVNESLSKHFKEHHFDEHKKTFESTLMLLDNLDAQKNEEAFIGPLRAQGSEGFFYPGGETDALAPVDAGYGNDVKLEYGVEMDKWVSAPGNVERWENAPGNGGLTASDRRVLMTQWVAAGKAHVDKKYYSLWRYFEKTGGLMTTDGTGDDKIEMPKYPDGVTSFDYADDEASQREVDEAAMWAASRVAKRMKTGN